MIFLVLVIVAIVLWAVLGNHDTAATKQILKEKERNADQKKVIRYFLNDGCLSKRMSDQEYDAMLSARLGDFKQRALNKIGLDESELQEIPPVHFQGYEKTSWERLGKDKNYRYSSFQITWLFFSSTQVYLYQYTFNMDSDDRKEITNEYFYKDITSFNTSTDTVETRFYDAKKKDFVVKNVDSTRFCITVPGDKFYCSMQQNDANERIVQAMKAKLREKKTA